MWLTLRTMYKILQYCEKMIKYFKEKIESNKIQIRYDEIIKNEQLYREKNNKYYPIAIFLKIINLKKLSSKIKESYSSFIVFFINFFISSLSIMK